MKHVIHKSKKIIMILFLSLSTCLLPPMTSCAKALPTISISPRKDDIRWVYKEIGGTLYRRQYNFTKNVWIGDWEPAYKSNIKPTYR